MNVFQLIPGAFYSADAYRQMRASQNFGMGYALLMVAITALAVVIFGATIFHQFALKRQGENPSLFEALAMQVVEQMPTMTYDKGVLATDKPEIYTIHIRGNDLPIEVKDKADFDFDLITIDTTGQTSIDTMKTPILITSKDAVLDDKEKNKKEVHSLAEMFKDQKTPLIINKAVAQDTLKRGISWLNDHAVMLYLIIGGIAWCFAIIFFFILRMVMLFLLGLIGIAYAGIQKVELTYASAVALASLSYTPVLLLDTLLFVVNGKSPMPLTLFIAGSVTLIFAIHVSNPPKPPQMVG